MKPELKMLHFQLTAKCNLNCPFCGQWGKNGFRAKKSPPEDLDVNYWKKAADSVVEYCVKRKCSLPLIIIWGGEPLLYGEFDEIARHLHSKGFNIGTVTNGTLLDKHRDTVNKYLRTLYISIDGNPEYHDRIRNRKGLFGEIKKNLAGINHDTLKVAMCTISEQNIDILPDIPFALENVNIDRLLFQNLMFTTRRDCQIFTEWLAGTFSLEANHVNSWVVSEWGNWIKHLPGALKKIKENIDNKRYPVETVILPEELTPENAGDWYLGIEGLPLSESKKTKHCPAPFRHLQIGADGNIFPCVDFDDFYAGNIKTDNLLDVWEGSLMNRFRKEIKAGRNPLCKRCSWRFNHEFKLT